MVYSGDETPVPLSGIDTGTPNTCFYVVGIWEEGRRSPHPRICQLEEFLNAHPAGFLRASVKKATLNSSSALI